MKKKYILPVAVTSLLTVSCADEFNPEFTAVEIPVDLAKIEELSDLTPLKENINRSAHPDFKVGAALDAKEFNKQLTVYNVGVTNFDEIVAGNAMKYASCVDNKGNMDFGTVSDFVNKADEAGISVYGHTLVWHSQQQPKYLTGLIADKPMPKPEGGTTTTKETEVANVTYSDGGFPFYPMGCEPPVEDGALHFTPTGDWSQFFITNAISLEAGTYKAIVTVKASEEASIKLTAQNGWGSDAQQMDGIVKLPTEWKDVEVKYSADFVGGNYDFILKPETVGAEIWVKNLRIVKLEEVSSGPALHEEFQQVAKTTYTDGGFPFYPMGCEPPVENGALHFTPTGDWSQFFITNAIALEAGQHAAIVRVKASKEASVKLTAQNGWGGDAQQMDGIVKLSTEWKDVEVKYSADFVGGNYDFILKPETVDAEIWVESLTVGKIAMVAGPVATQVAQTTYKDGGFPFYPMGCEPPVEDGALHFTPTGDWSQFFITNAIGLEPGEYTAKVMIKASKEGSMKLTTQNGWSDAQQMDGNVKVGTDWADVEVKFSAEFVGGNYDFILKPEMFDGEVWVKSLTIFKWETPSDNGGGVEVEKTFTEKKPTLVVTSQDKVNEAWDTQFWIMTDGYDAGASYEFSADVRADIKATASTQIHNGPGEYVHYACVGEVPFTPEWETYSSKGTLDQAGKSIAFNLNDQAKGTKYYFRNISFKVNGKEMVKNGNLASDDNSAFYSKEYPGNQPFNTEILPQISYTKMVNSNTIPLTKEEKDSIISIQLDRWIAGMMDACGGKVKAWDLANELISGGAERVDGRYALQHGEEGDDQNFYWQDYLGDEKVVQFAVASARQHYAESMTEQGGDDGKLKLFINDYNLESDWDQNGKLKSLIDWIKVWEADGVTKIDGIGSQMHISYYEDPATLERKKNAIAESFKLMAATGKLVRISELDMGYVKADGKDATLAEMYSADQVKAGYPMEKAMADYYQWIIEKYFEIVPAAQQYGITQWCLTDSEAGSGWRADTPVGLWDLNWNRKYTYRGWVNGLQK